MISSSYCVAASNLEIQSLFSDYGIDGSKITCGDELYALPDYDWLFADFARALQTLQNAFFVWNWIDQKNDCDDFARGAAWLAQVLNNNTTTKAEALAIGEFWYVRDVDSQAHAITVAICKIGDERKMVFMEPQNQTHINLSDNEIRSCVYCRF